MGWYAHTTARAAAVILVHGRDACRGEELRVSTFDLALALRDNGLSVLMLDLRGHGESAGSRLTFGQREHLDVLGAVDFLLARGYPEARIGVLGASMGGVCALTAAAREPAIGAVVSDSAFADFNELLQRNFVSLTRMPRVFLHGAMLLARVLTGERLHRAVPLLDVARLGGRPLLVIHSADDPIVPVHHAHALVRRARASLWVTPGDRHLSSYRSNPLEYEQRVCEFFTQHLLNVHSARAESAVGSPTGIPIAI